YWKNKDPRRLYSGGAGWPILDATDFNSTPMPRIQAWGEELNSIINAKPPQTNYDWIHKLPKNGKPTVSHEIGQWCVYPDFKEIAQYTGVLKARNFEIFQESLRKNNMEHLADSFLLASGKLQTLCYKADIEAALRTPGFAGFQLLDLHDFPGQGTALVGVLNPFWDSKGYVTPREYSRFCNATVPLVRLPKMIYRSDETLIAAAEIAHFGPIELSDTKPVWKITDAEGQVRFTGELAPVAIPLGNGIKLGDIVQPLNSINNPEKLTLSLQVSDFENTWDIWVYPAVIPETDNDILVAQKLDSKVLDFLNNGGKVLLTPEKGCIRSERGGAVAVGFSSIFWNTAWTHQQAPHTLGILCNPNHPALAEFPTEFHSNWQWWDAMSHSNAVLLTSFKHEIKPIVRIIDDWFTNRPLALIFEAKVGQGKIIVSGIDLLTDTDKRPEARQLLYSLLKYMEGSTFNPSESIYEEELVTLLKE
ncbi:MAG: beta-galactosidase, partial [Bacteroidales bacterium]|nr:beta-galactosidase [Bacteroidales bacterium]